MPHLGETAALVASPPSGRFTPTSSATTNVAATTANEALYFYVGDMVHVCGTVSIDPTAASVVTQIYLTIPAAVASVDFVATTDARGGAVRGGTASDNISGVVLAVVATDTVVLSYMNDTDIADRTWTYWYDFKVR